MKFDYKAWLDSMHRRLHEIAATEGYRMVKSHTAAPSGQSELEKYITKSKVRFCSELSAFYCEASSEVMERWECSEVGPMDNGKRISIGFQLPHFKNIKRLTTNAARLLYGFAVNDNSGTVGAVLRHGYLFSAWEPSELLFIVSTNEDIASGMYFWVWNKGMTRCADSLVDWLKFVASVDYQPPILQTIERYERSGVWFPQRKPIRYK